MEPKIIVMIVMLANASGEASVQVKPMPSPERCRAAADIEASDPFVQQVECAELADGVLHLDFKAQEPASPATPSADYPDRTG